ncbi:CHAT domain-containing protein [Phormidesmis sp. 146-33]
MGKLKQDLAKAAMKQIMRLSIPLLVLGLSFASLNAHAQSIAPSSDGTGTIVTPNGNQLDITGGTRSADGANLFHSFSQFGLNQNQIANFLSNPTIQNILGRVNGGDVSIINGLIQVTGGSSNLFLINPAGIIFGDSARLNVPASFTATTATGIGFGSNWWNVADINYSALLGSPNAFAFTNQPGAIVNTGNLTVGQGNLSLFAGTIASPGQLSAPQGQVLLATIPGQSLMRLSQVGSLLSLDIQPTATTGQSLPIVTLPQMLTGGVGGNATGFTVTNGQVQLTGSGFVIENGDIVAKTVTAQTATLAASQTLTLIESQLQTTGALNLLAKDTVRVRDSLTNPFLARSGGNLTVSGDRAIDILALNHLRQTPFVSGGDLSLISDGIVSGDAHFISQGRFSILNLSGGGGNFVSLYDPIVSADGDVTFGNYTGVALKVEATGSITAGDITITGPDVDLASICLTACSPDAQILADLPAVILRAGVTTLEETAFGYPGSVFGSPPVAFGSTDFGSGSPSTIASITTGNIRTEKPSNPFGGPENTVILTAPGDITTGAIDTSVTGIADSRAGSVSLTAGRDILTGAINTSTNIEAFVDGSNAGFVTLQAGQNLTFESITTSALSQSGAGTGGRVRLLADNGQIRGTGFVAASPTDTIFTRSTNATGSVEIRHDGGPNNNPFIVGDATTNGTAGSISTNTVTIAPTTIFESVGTIDQGNPAADGVRFVFNNVAPGITVNSNLPDTPENQPVTLSLSDLAPTATDANNDFTTITVATIAPGAILKVDGIELQPGANFPLGRETGTIEYTPPPGTTGQIVAFTLAASDRISSSVPVPVSVTITSTSPPPSTPPAEPVPPTLPEPEPTEPILNPPTTPEAAKPDYPDDVEAEPAEEPEAEIAATDNPSGTIVEVDPFVSEIEDSLTDTFETYLGESDVQAETLPEVRDTLSKVERATGVKPAIVYALFVPSSLAQSSDPSIKSDGQQKLGASPQRDSDELELFVVTSTGQPIRRRVPGATRATVLKLTQQFQREVSDSRKSQTTSYLESSQVLYQKLMAPIESDLQTRKITNLVFVTDLGLRSLPLAALHDGKGFLIERYSIGMMPSLSLTDTRLGDIQKSQILAMGASQFSQQTPLPAVPQEISAISNIWKGRTFLNEGFTLNNLKTQRQQQPFGIIHLATHAEFRSGPLGNSYIQLSDTQLRLDQIRQLGWSNPPVELLVLSACRTALGDQEAELGFAGLAVKAGVKSAMASLWAVSDQGTLLLMTDFYQQLKKTPIKAEALRQAQLSLLKGRVKSESQTTSFAHPYYWASFTMVGSPW